MTKDLTLEDLTLNITKETQVNASLEITFEALLDQLGPYNERGYWESQTVSKFDESVLRQLGGTWSAPPLTAAGWEATEE